MSTATVICPIWSDNQNFQFFHCSCSRNSSDICMAVQIDGIWTAMQIEGWRLKKLSSWTMGVKVTLKCRRHKICSPARIAKHPISACNCDVILRGLRWFRKRLTQLPYTNVCSLFSGTWMLVQNKHIHRERHHHYWRLFSKGTILQLSSSSAKTAKPHCTEAFMLFRSVAANNCSHRP